MIKEFSQRTKHIEKRIISGIARAKVTSKNITVADDNTRRRSLIRNLTSVVTDQDFGL